MADPLSIAVVGLGKHAVRTVVPGILRCADTRLARIVVRDAAGQAERHPELAPLITDDLTAVLADSDIDAVYVATPLSTHMAFVEAALQAGKHVLSEKPVTASLAETRRLASLAAQARRGLFEIDYYQYHAQFRELQASIRQRCETGEQIVSVETVFTIPELPDDDIRYRADLDGGALFDVGYYPLSGALALFGTPATVTASGRWDDRRGVDLSGSALLGYTGFAVHAHWAIGASYRNEIAVGLTRSRLLAVRGFAKPADLATQIGVTNAFGAAEPPVELAADDAFATMLAEQARLIGTGSTQDIDAAREAIVARAVLIETVRAQIFLAAPGR